MVDTLLLLGGSQQQVVALERAKGLGYRTVLCDYLPDNPGRYVADAFYQVSTTDRDAVLEVANAERVGGVLAYASDPAAPVAAYVAERLGLPTNPPASVEILSDKRLFREHLQKTGLPCPRSASFDTSVNAEDVKSIVSSFTYPLVVKPTDSSGSKGVAVVHAPYELDDALEAARRFSRNGVLIAEEFIERSFPYLIGGDIFVVDGKVRLWGLMRCLRDESAPLVPQGKAFPVGLEEDRMGSIQEVLQRLVTSLNLRFGEFNVEVLLGPSNTPFVLELGARAGGNMIPIQLSDVFGIDLIEQGILCAMGKAVEFPHASGGVGSYLTVVPHALKNGMFEGIDYSQAALKALYREVLYKQCGDYVERFSGADKALGIVFFRFCSEGEMHEFVNALNSHIRVKVGS